MNKIIKINGKYVNKNIINLNKLKNIKNINDSNINDSNINDSNINDSNINDSNINEINFINFDWQTYIDNYEDLRIAGINTKKKAWNHWINYGKKENRDINKSINKSLDNNLNNNLNKQKNNYEILILKNKLKKNKTMIDNNLNNIDLSYDEIIQYYELYINNDILKKILTDIINSYNFNYEPEKYFRKENNIYCRNIYENYNIIFMINNILNNNIIGYCYKTKQKYLCNGISYHTDINNLYEIIGYHFNNNDFIIYYLWEYYTPYAIYYPKNNIIYNISYRYKNIDIKLLLNHYKNNYYISSPGNIKYTMGIMCNSGHYFWNEIMGLMLLIKYNILNYIDNFIIYKYDYLNIGKIIKEKYNKNVIYFNDNINNLNYYHVNVTKHYISNDLIDIFKNIFGIKSIPYSLKYKKEINILFDIRTNSRVCLNQNEIIINLTDKLKLHFPDVRFNYYISGVYTHSNNKIIFKKDLEIQNKFVKNIKLTNSNINFINLVGENLIDLIYLCNNIDICIHNVGSGIGLYYLIIYNKLHFGLCNSYYLDDCKMQLNAFNLNNNYCKMINKELVINKSNVYNIFSDYEIKINETVDYLYEEISKYVL